MSAHLKNVLWSRVCQVSGECHRVNEMWSQRVDLGSCSRAAAAGVGLSPERPSIRVEIIIAISNTQCCMRSGTQSAAQGEANPSFLRFRVSRSPCCFSVASTRGNFRFDAACGRGLLSRFVGPSRSQIAWGQGFQGDRDCRKSLTARRIAPTILRSDKDVAGKTG